MPAPTKPSLYMGWVPGGGSPYVTQPTSSQQTTGWLPGEVPPPDYMNWLFWLADSWIQWLDYEVENVIGNASGITANSTVLSTTGNITIGSNQLTNLASVAGVTVGMLIVAGAVPGNTFVQAISGTTITMSNNAASNLNNNPTSFEHTYATGNNVQSQLDELDATLVLLSLNAQRNVTANTSLLKTDSMVRSDSTSGNLTHTLPAVASTPFGKVIVIKDVGTGGNTTQVKGNGSETIDGNNTYATALNIYDSITVRNNGTTWDTI